MNNLIVIPARKRSNVPTIGKNIFFGQGFEPESYDHWIFNTEYSKQGLFNQVVIEPLNNPIFNGKTVTCTTTNDTETSPSLNSKLGGGSTAGNLTNSIFTVAIVFKTQSTDISLLDFTDFDSRLKIAGSTLSFNFTNSSQPLTSNTYKTGVWNFAAISFDLATHNVQHLYCANNLVSGIISDAVISSPRGSYVRIGALNATENQTVEFAEMVAFEKQLTPDEIEALYQRSKVRMSKIGIEI